jgi:hypothetical protein
MCAQEASRNAVWYNVSKYTFMGFMKTDLTSCMLCGAGENAGLLGHDLFPVQLLQVVLWRQQHQHSFMRFLLVAHLWHGSTQLPLEL